MEVRGEGERHHGGLSALCRYSHGGLGGGGNPCDKKEKSRNKDMKGVNQTDMAAEDFKEH